MRACYGPGHRMHTPQDPIPVVVRPLIRMVALGWMAGVVACTPADPGGADDSTSSAPATVGSTTAAMPTDGLDSSDSGSTSAADECWTDLMPGQTEVLYEGFADGSEGLTFGPDGVLYVTTDGLVWQITADGVATEFAMVPDALGLAARADGSFVVASIGQLGAADGAVYTVDADGVATELATGIDSPNFVALTPGGIALISDDFDTRVFAVTTAGEVSVAIADVPSPNGIAYGPAGDVLFVASTFSPQAQLTRYDVDDQGFPVEATALEIMHLGAMATPDGIAVDAEGRVYVAANLPGEVWRVDGMVQALTEGELFASGLGSPASLAFGEGEGYDPCSLYVTQLSGPQVLRLAVGTPGAPVFR